MLKKLVSRIKTIFGKKAEPASKPVTPSSFESRTSHSQRNRVHHKPSGDRHHPREHRKKETPEEYRARREKRQPHPTPPVEVKQKETWSRSVFQVPAVAEKTRFHDFELPDEVMRAIYDLKFRYCTPVQAETLVRSLAGGDVAAQAQTGTGKTAAFLITIFSHMLKQPLDEPRRTGTPRALILAPTRELVMQIEKDARDLGKYIPCTVLALFGGMDYVKQQRVLQNEPCEILICTPGRLMDFQKKRLVHLSKVEILILDEADRMLDMGFIPAVRSIVQSTPPKAKRQTMFFSATITPEVQRLAESWTREAFEVRIMPGEVAVQSIDQITYITTSEEKPALLYNLIMQKHLERVLMFVNRRSEARLLKEKLETYGISCALLSGDVEQKQRIHRLEQFRSGKIRVLVATDVASRGLHIEAISHVINYNMPRDKEEYVHRIGRTGRAGASGISINFADEDDSYELGALEEFLGKKIKCIYPEAHLLEPIPELPPRPASEKRERKPFHPRRRPPRRRSAS
ncbi:MAG: DEAD/DEAH box helicase [bacterium]